MDSTTNGLIVIKTVKDTSVTNLYDNCNQILSECDTTKAKQDFKTKLATKLVRWQSIKNRITLI